MPSSILLFFYAVTSHWFHIRDQLMGYMRKGWVFYLPPTAHNSHLLIILNPKNVPQIHHTEKIASSKSPGKFNFSCIYPFTTLYIYNHFYRLSSVSACFTHHHVWNIIYYFNVSHNQSYLLIRHIIYVSTHISFFMHTMITFYITCKS